MADFVTTSLVAAAMASIGQLTTKASGSMVGCPMTAGVCQVDCTILATLMIIRLHETWQNRYYHTVLPILQPGAWLWGHVSRPSLMLSD